MQLRGFALTLGGLAIVAGSFWITLIGLQHIKSGGATRVPLDSFYVVPGCSFSGGAAEKLLTTLPEPGSYAATALLPFPPSSAAPGKVRARLQVLEGRLGILVAENAAGAAAIVDKAVDVTAEPVQVDVDLPTVARARQVVLRNLNADGMRTRARIISIEAVM